MRLLAIETSCDETGVSLVDVDVESRAGTILADELASQAALHAEYGGVYPTLAKREHQKALPLLLERVMRGYDATSVSAIAVTHGPGLEPALWTGIEFAKSLAHEWGKLIVPVNHMEGHIYSALLKREENSKFTILNPNYPAVALLISGGHTDITLITGEGEPACRTDRYEYLGSTRDDAVGEAFDKVARMLALGYPGGPLISKLAQEARDSNLPPLEQSLPRPMLKSGDFDFSFSGLKTAVLYHIKRATESGHVLTEDEQRQVAREFEDAAADVLASKVAAAAAEHGAQTLIIGGGVAANSHINTRIKEQFAREHLDIAVYTPGKGLAGDNALMIAIAGAFRAERGEYLTEGEELRAHGTLRL